MDRWQEQGEDVRGAVRPVVLDRLIGEAAALAVDVRDALTRNRAPDRAAIVRLHTRHELSALVTCLACATEWLLEQKAVTAGRSAPTAPSRLRVELRRPRIHRATVDAGTWMLGDRVRAFGARIERLAAARPARSSPVGPH